MYYTIARLHNGHGRVSKGMQLFDVDKEFVFKLNAWLVTQTAKIESGRAIRIVCDELTIGVGLEIERA